MKKIAIGVGILLILVAVVGIFSLVKARGALKDFVANDKQLVIDKVDQFIFDIVSNKPNEAYALTDQKSIPIETLSNPDLKTALLKYERQDPDFKHLRVISWLSGEVTAEYQTVIYFSDNTQGQMSIVIRKVDGSWKMKGFSVATPPDKLW